MSKKSAPKPDRPGSSTLNQAFNRAKILLRSNYHQQQDIFTEAMRDVEKESAYAEQRAAAAEQEAADARQNAAAAERKATVANKDASIAETEAADAQRKAAAAEQKIKALEKQLAKEKKANDHLEENEKKLLPLANAAYDVLHECEGIPLQNFGKVGDAIKRMKACVEEVFEEP